MISAAVTPVDVDDSHMNPPAPTAYGGGSSQGGSEIGNRRRRSISVSPMLARMHEWLYERRQGGVIYLHRSQRRSYTIMFLNVVELSTSKVQLARYVAWLKPDVVCL